MCSNHILKAQKDCISLFVDIIQTMIQVNGCDHYIQLSEIRSRFSKMENLMILPVFIWRTMCTIFFFFFTESEIYLKVVKQSGVYKHHKLQGSQILFPFYFKVPRFVITFYVKLWKISFSKNGFKTFHVSTKFDDIVFSSDHEIYLYNF